MEHDDDYARWRAWCAQQLTAAGWPADDPSGVRVAVDACLDVIGAGMGRDSLHVPVALDIVSRLLKGHALTEEAWSPTRRLAVAEERSVWVRVQPGQALDRQERVRVRPDAYTGDRSLTDNGRTGTITSVRYGHAMVHYDGEPPGTWHDHDIRLLDRAVQRT